MRVATTKSGAPTRVTRMDTGQVMHSVSGRLKKGSGSYASTEQVQKFDDSKIGPSRRCALAPYRHALCALRSFAPQLCAEDATQYLKR
jgi:hypothetical protein